MQERFADEELLKEALGKGEKEAYRFLMKAYYKKLSAYAYNLCQDKDLAEDIVQNVILRLWRNREKTLIANKLSSFLYRSVYNEFIDQYRKSKEVIALQKKHIESLSSILEEEKDENLNTLIKVVNDEIEQLPKKCKKTFLMSKKEGLTNFEIADYLNISIKTVEAHITSAYKILRNKMAKYTDR